MTDVRAGLAEVKDELASFEHDGRTYWHAPADPPPPDQEPRGHLLQMLDEMLPRLPGLALRAGHRRVWCRGGARRRSGMALVDGQMLAWMKRTLGKDAGRLRPDAACATWRPTRSRRCEEAARRYGAFLGLEARLRR